MRAVVMIKALTIALIAASTALSAAPLDEARAARIVRAELRRLGVPSPSGTEGSSGLQSEVALPVGTCARTPLADVRQRCRRTSLEAGVACPERDAS